MAWWNFLTLVDTIHNSLQFLLPLLIFLTLKLFFKSKLISVCSFIFSIIFLLILQFQGSQFEIILILKVLNLVLITIFIYLICNFLNPKIGKCMEYLAGISLFLFFATQFIYNGCIIHYYQNQLAQKYLALDIWLPVRLFASEFCSPLILKISYGLLSISIFYKMVTSLQTQVFNLKSILNWNFYEKK